MYRDSTTHLEHTLPSYLSERRDGSLVYFFAPGWDVARVSVHAFFGRHGGVSQGPYDSLNTSTSTGDDPECVRENIGRIARALGSDGRPVKILSIRQVHSNRVVSIRSEEPHLDPASVGGCAADGIVTDRADLFLSVRTADCLPVAFLDPARPAIGIAHAGWRGTLKGILERCLEAMERAFHTDPATVRVLFGPGIGPCCFVVDRDVADAFLAAYPGLEGIVRPVRDGKWAVDLYRANASRLLGAGVSRENLFCEPLCTCCRKESFFSVRAQGPRTGRQMSVIGLESP